MVFRISTQSFYFVFFFPPLGVHSLKYHIEREERVVHGAGRVDLVNQHIRLFMDRMFLFETPWNFISGRGLLKRLRVRGR